LSPQVRFGGGIISRRFRLVKILPSAPFGFRISSTETPGKGIPRACVMDLLHGLFVCDAKCWRGGKRKCSPCVRLVRACALEVRDPEGSQTELEFEHVRACV